MDDDSPSISVIVGCGYLGMRLLNRLPVRGDRVFASTRSPEKQQHLLAAGATPVLLDTNQSSTWDGLLSLAGRRLEFYVLLPPGQVEIGSLAAFVSLLQHLGPRRLVLCSSSVVYGGRARIVDADSPVELDNRRAQRQFDIEQAFSMLGDALRVVRLAGLYGHERIIGRQSVMAAEPLPGSARSYLNLVHVEDAATLLLRVMTADTAAPVELGCDGRPVTRGRYYADLAQYLEARAPVFLGEGDSIDRGRQCDNRPTMARTAWQPRFTDYREGWLAAQ